MRTQGSKIGSGQGAGKWDRCWHCMYSSCTSFYFQFMEERNLMFYSLYCPWHGGSFGSLLMGMHLKAYVEWSQRIADHKDRPCWNYSSMDNVYDNMRLSLRNRVEDAYISIMGNSLHILLNIFSSAVQLMFYKGHRFVHSRSLKAIRDHWIIQCDLIHLIIFYPVPFILSLLQ